MATTAATTRRRRTLTVTTAFLALSIVGVAFAAWVADGSGDGYVASGESQAVYTATVAASTTSLLYPDGDADVRLQIVNDNPFKVEVTDINNAAVGDIESGDTDCDPGHEVTFTDQSGSWVVPANGTLNVELADAASMGTGSDTDCQNQTFTIPVDLVGASTGLDADTGDF